MVEQAKSLAIDHNRLEEIRLQQRHSSRENSELLDHAGLAVSLENAFRTWWRHWLQQQNWPTKCKPGLRPADIKIYSTHTCEQQRLQADSRFGWVHYLMKSVNGEKLKDKEWFRLQSLRPWGEAVTLFAQAEPMQCFGLAGKGASTESQHWWKQTYPQLMWDTEGPLASR